MKKEFLKILSILLLIAILFTEQGKNTWKLFFGAGLIFGLIWFFKK